MSKCNCGSYAINPHLHGRMEGVDLELCDVCYWRKRASSTGMSGHVRVPVEPTEEMIDAGVAMSRQVTASAPVGWSEYVRALYKQMLNASKGEQ